MTQVLPGPGDCGPGISAIMARGEIPELLAGDYYLSQLVWPPALPGHPQPCWALKGAGHDVTRVHCLSSPSAVFLASNLGIAPRGVKIEGLTLYADGHTPGAAIEFAGQAPDATVALTFPVVKDFMALGLGAAPVVKISNSMCAVLLDVVGEGTGPVVDILDCGEITVERAQAIGGTGPAFRLRGSFGSHMAEGATFVSCWSNGQEAGWEISGWSDFRASGCDVSSASGLACHISGYFTDFKFTDCDFNSTGQGIQVDDNTRGGGPAGNDLEFVGCNAYGGNYGAALNGKRIRVLGGEWHEHTNVDFFIQNCQDWSILGVEASSPNGDAPLNASLWESSGMGSRNGNVSNCGTRGLVHLEDAQTIANSKGNYRIA